MTLGRVALKVPSSSQSLPGAEAATTARREVRQVGPEVRESVRVTYPPDPDVLWACRGGQVNGQANLPDSGLKVESGAVRACSATSRPEDTRVSALSG